MTVTSILTGILISFGVLAAYLLLALTHPVVTCLGCRGKKVRKPRNGKGRARRCRTCKAMGLMVLPAAGSVHRFYWSVLGDRIHEKQQADLATRLANRNRKQGPAK